MVAHECFVTAVFSDDTVFYDQDFVCLSHCTETVGNQKDNFVVGNPQYIGEYLFFCFRVDVGGWFVENDNGSIPKEGAGEGNSLPLAFAGVDSATIFLVQRVAISERKVVDETMDTGELGGGLNALDFRFLSDVAEMDIIFG